VLPTWGVTNLMRDYSKFLELFHEIGLTEREVKVYIPLLQKRMFTASELAEVSNVPRTKIYEVIQKMIHKGICVEKKNGRNRVFEAIEPQIAFGNLYDNYKTELIRKEEVISKLVDVFTPVYTEGRVKENPLDYIEVLTNNNHIHKKYLSLVHNAHKEILTFNKPPYACDTPDTLGEQERAEIELIKRGGISKGLYEYDELEEESHYTETEKLLTEYGHQSRYIKSLPVKMIIFDRKTVMFALDQPKSPSDNLTMIVIEHKSLANASTILFDFLWSQAEELKKY